MKTTQHAGSLRRHSAFAHLQWLQGGVLHMRLTGLATAVVLGAFADEACEHYGGMLRGFVLDYRSAVIAATTDELAALLERVAPASPLRKPAAFITGPAGAWVLQQQAIRMATAGYYRRAFASVEHGHAWVVKIAQRGY